MAWFFVETYAPRDTDSVGLHICDVALAAERVSAEGVEVRFAQAIFVADDETCFFLFESSSVAAVREAVRRADLPFARIAEALPIGPTETRLGRGHGIDNHEQIGVRK